MSRCLCRICLIFILASGWWLRQLLFSADIDISFSAGTTMAEVARRTAGRLSCRAEPGSLA
jgi:hypothetical protein